MTYETPTVTDFGSLVDLTEQNFNKNPGGTDTITIGNNPPITVPGSGTT
jgi:hypothetical protein